MNTLSLRPFSDAVARIGTASGRVRAVVGRGLTGF